MNTGKRNRKSNIKSRIIERQAHEIESLKKRISELEIDCDEKDELINSVDSLRIEMEQIVEDLKSKGEVYDKLVEELTEMKKIMNEEVFKNKWWLIRFLLK